MGYREMVQKELKGTKPGSLWQEICESYELGGIEQIKKKLDSLTDQTKKDYMKLLQILEENL